MNKKITVEMKVIDEVQVTAEKLIETIDQYRGLGYGVQVDCTYRINGITGGVYDTYQIQVLKPVEEVNQ